MDGKPCWIGDLLHALQTLPSPVNVQDPLADLCDEEKIKELISEVQNSLEKDILRDINSYSGLYLLRGRLEPMENAPP